MTIQLNCPLVEESVRCKIASEPNLRSLDEAVPKSLAYSFRLRVDLQLVINTSEVKGHGMRTDAQFDSGRPVPVTFRQEFQ